MTEVDSSLRTDARTFHYRDTASFGRRQEYVVAAQLFKRGFDVYMTLVDDQGIDCVIRLDEHRYVDIQIKACSLYVEKTERLWVIPSVSLAQLARQNKTGANAGCYTIDLPTLLEGERHDRLARIERDNGFELLHRYPRL